jgi:hypothetical protein
MLTRSAVKSTVATGWIILWSVAGSAHAGQIPGAPVLAPVSVNGDVAISLADYAVVLKAPGTKFLTAPIFIPDGPGYATPACTAQGFCDYGTGEISATLGIDPTVLLSANPTNNGGGDSSLEMTYQVEYGNSTEPAGTVVHPDLLVNDSLDVIGDSAAEAFVVISGPNGIIYNSTDCQSGLGAAFGCGAGDGPLADQMLNMVVNEPYTVDMFVQIYSHDAVSATIDPMFVAPPTGNGQFYFSQGISEGGGVPEPATWTLMLAAFFAAGTALRRWRLLDTVSAT